MAEIPTTPPQQKTTTPTTEWRTYEKGKQPLMRTEFDLKTYILDIPKDIDFNNLLSLVTKELDTSFINEQDSKIYYQILFENILEWANMGLTNMAKLRLANLFSELKLEKSVGGFERILQGSTLTGTVVTPLPRQPKLFSIEGILKRKEKTEVPPILPSR